MRFNAVQLPSQIKAALHTIRAALIGVFSASLIVNLLMLAGPIFMLQVYDRVLPSKSVPTLLGLLFIVAAMFLIQGIVDTLRSRLLARTAHALDEILRGDIFARVQNNALAKSTGDPLQLLRDLDNCRSFVTGAGIVAACDLPWTPIYILVCTLFHPLMGLAVFIGAALLFGVTVATEIMTRAPTRALVGLASGRRIASETACRHAEAIYALGITRRMSDIWSDRTTEYLDAQNRVADLSGGFGSISRLLRMALQSGVLALGAYLVINQEATAGVMLAATILSIRALNPIEQAIANWRNFITCRESFSRLCKEMSAVKDHRSITKLPAPKQHLSVVSLSVTAPSNGPLILHDINFSIEAGQAIAVIGTSGSGKSTLARALVGAWKPIRGYVRLDGAPLDQWDSDRIGASLGFLPQEVSLFKGTVAENVSRFATEADPQKLLAATQSAGVHDMILRLPSGYETEIGDEGTSLSGGQRQRIALARALYGNPFLLVLDEPNSNLDAMGEAALARAITDVRSRDGIVVVISHRPEILNVVDKVLVLHEGRMRAFGNAKEMIASAQPAAPPPKRRRQNQKRQLDAAE